MQKKEPKLRDALASTSNHIALSVADIAQHAELLAAATSENTRRTYRSAIRHYLQWGGVLPADATILVRYLMAHLERHNPRTLSLRLTALSQWHIQQGFPDPAADITVRKTMSGISRLHGTPKKKAKALPLEDLIKIVINLNASDTLKAKRDNALLQLAFFGGFRRSEISQLEMTQVEQESQGITITLRRSKTDQSGEGISRAIPYGNDECCPASALQEWLKAAKITSGPIFRKINRWGQLSEKAISPASVNSILADCADTAGLTYAPELSSHSLRRGMATSAYRAGADFREIKRQGGWRHDGTVHGYIEEASRFTNNAAGLLLEKQGTKKSLIDR
ncbi:site-specific integrase [Undibacterium sp. SXout7W]|uniref:site-specific integrase n=1 Tax=Undibacterium sp. SXout7W TaxID=3413049 RepID=UPI003BF3FF7B